jgi:uncharacterized damage-inducible protein DinB
MPISMHRAIRHMSWANQRVYASFATLPDEALDSYITNPEWSARKILQHIVASSDFYVYCLGIAHWHDIPNPKTIADVATLAQTLDLCDSQILTAADLEEELLSFEEGDRVVKVQRSTLLAEAVLHATEHRAQLMDAIESRGFSTITLDSIDLWAFEYFERKGS